jgi:hypothetical protein
MAEESRFNSQYGQEIFLFAIIIRSALRLTQPPIQEVWGALSPGVKHLGLEADHSLTSSAETKKDGAMSAFRHTYSWHSA